MCLQCSEAGGEETKGEEMMRKIVDYGIRSEYACMKVRSERKKVREDERD